MSKERKLIPELRFPEFVNDGEWEIEELGEISEIVRGGSPRPIQDYLTSDINGLNWLKIADVPSDAKYITGTKERVIHKAINSTREVNPGDLILSNSMSFGRPYILKIRTCIHDGWIAIRKISNKTYEDYLFYYISSEASQSYFNVNAAGAAVKNLNAEIIKLLPIQLPKLKAEQQKIAACLSSLDELIAAHNDKLEALKDHKKGLMQNLFPQEGETVPKMRFPEFENDGEWVERAIGEFAPLQRGFDLPVDNIEFGEYPVVFSNGILKYHKEFKVQAPGVVTGRSGTIGKVTYVEKNFWPHNTSLWVTDFCGNFPMFVYYYYVFIGLDKFGTGSGVPTLNRNDVHRHILFNPPTIQEQQKIASCLSAVDNLISAQQDKIEQLQQHKKGLMQGMFPKIEN